MWTLYLNGDLVLASTDHDDLIFYLSDYQPGTYRAEVDRIEDPRLIEAIAPAQAASGIVVNITSLDTQGSDALDLLLSEDDFGPSGSRVAAR